MVRYGIFEVGQIWQVVSPDRQAMGFPSREAALAAAQFLQRAHRMCGDRCELLAVDESGRLVELAVPDVVAARPAVRPRRPAHAGEARVEP